MERDCPSCLNFLLGILPHEELRPYATKVLKEYQFNRLDPNTHHQKAATAIALGGLTGSGWKKSEFTGGGWCLCPIRTLFFRLCEEFGFLGLTAMLGLYYALLYFSFQVTAVAKGSFWTTASSRNYHLSCHACSCQYRHDERIFSYYRSAFVLISYGGSSVLATMTALGTLQSIYSRRFMF